jgi:transposase-like protein
MSRKLERADAKRLYCEEMMEIAEISRQRGIPEKTIYRWRKQDAEKGSDWDKEREEIRITPLSAYKQSFRALVAKLAQLAQDMEKGEKPDYKYLHGITELAGIVRKMGDQVDMLGNVLLAMREFTDFLAERDPAVLSQLRPYLQEFGTEMKKKYGKR